MGGPRARLTGISLAALAFGALGGVDALRDTTPEPPTFTGVTCSWRAGRVMVRGALHVRAGGSHDYYVEPLFRLDGGRLEHYYDRFFYDLGRGASVAWHASVAPNWPGRKITYCSGRGGVLAGNPEAE